jgi:hypothetical protein
MNALIWRKRFAYLLTTAGLAALTALPVMAHQQEQSSSQQSSGDPLADAARKAREQKKKEAAKPKKVYTDDDLNHAVPETPATPPGQAPVDGTGNAAAKNSTKQGDAATGPETNQDRETKWRKRFKEAYGKMALAKKELDILQREENKAQTQYYPDPQKAMNEGYSRKDINEKSGKIDAKKKEIAQLKQQISDMEDDLRKDGGDPGWAAP